MPESQTTKIPSQETVENEPVDQYGFLKSLSADNPALADQISKKIPGWKKWMNDNLNQPQVTEHILQSIDYVSLNEMAKTIQNWAKEVVEFLEANPDRKIVILRGVGGSQRYFGEMVYKQIPETLRQRVTLEGDRETRNNLSQLTRDFDSFIKTDFFLFDDSINSGQQITGMVIPDAFYMARKLEENAFGDDRGGDFLDFAYGRSGQKPRFNIRTMRITKYAEEQIQKKWLQRKKAADMERNAQYPESIIMDLKSEKEFFTINEVLDPLDIQWENGIPAILFRQDHVVGYPILGFFGTKIQDNLPSALLQSKLTPQDLPALFKQSDIQTPWKSLSNTE